MKVHRKLLAGLVAIIAANTAPGLAARAETATDTHDKARAIIVQSEKDWVAAVVSGDTTVMDRIMAADVIDVDTEGRFLDKAKVLEGIKEAPKYFTSNVLDHVTVRFFGDTVAVAQGSETWTGRNGLPAKGQFVFTDTWVLRDGRWQVVATQALTPPMPK